MLKSFLSIYRLGMFSFLAASIHCSRPSELHRPPLSKCAARYVLGRKTPLSCWPRESESVLPPFYIPYLYLYPQHATDLPTETAHNALSVLVEAVSVAVGWRPRRFNQTELAPVSKSEIVYVPPSQFDTDRPSFPHEYKYIWYQLVYVTIVYVFWWFTTGNKLQTILQLRSTSSL
jgi:hypothetical protein